MTGFVVLLVLIIAGVIYLVWVSSGTESASPRLPEPPPTEAEVLQARLDLLAVERGVDVVLAKQEQRQASERIKAAIAEALENDRP